MISLVKIISEIKILGKNYIRPYNSFEEFSNDNPNFPHVDDPRMYNAYIKHGAIICDFMIDNKKYVGYTDFKGELAKDFTDKYNNQIKDKNILKKAQQLINQQNGKS